MKDIQELADHIGANYPTETSLSRRVYKDTACGAWLSVVKNEDDSIWGVRIGSIVEGSDAEVGPVDLPFPITESDWDAALSGIEEEVNLLWTQAHKDSKLW